MIIFLKFLYTLVIIYLSDFIYINLHILFYIFTIYYNYRY